MAAPSEPYCSRLPCRPSGRLLLDYLKGAVPVSLAHLLYSLSGWAVVPVALAPILGHAFSPFLRFRGGKAIAATFGVWTGLTLWAGPTLLGISLGLAYALNATDAWSALSGFFVLLPYLLLSRAPAPFWAIWAGNLALVLWKHRRDLRTPPRPRWIHYGHSMSDIPSNAELLALLDELA